MKFITTLQARLSASFNQQFRSYLAWLRREDGPSRWGLLLLFLLAITYFTLPDSLLLDLPVLDSDAGKIMQFSFRAGKDISIIDEDKTRQNRMNAEAKVPNQYLVINNSASYEKMRSAFVMMRSFIKERELTTLRKSGAEIPKEFEGLIKERLYSDLLDRSTPLSEELRRDLLGMKATVEESTGRILNESLYVSLVENLFNPKVDEWFFKLIDKLNSYTILRIGLPSDYAQNVIQIQQGESQTPVPRYRLITRRTLSFELAHLQKTMDIAKELTPQGVAMVIALTETLLKDNISFSEEETTTMRNEARKKAPVSEFSVKYGELIRRAGEKITEQDIKIFRAIRAVEQQKSIWSVAVKNFIYLFLVVFVMFVAFNHNIKKAKFTVAELLLMGVLLLFLLLLWKSIIAMSIPFSDWMGNVDARIFYFLLPFPALIAIVKLLVNTETALFFLLTTILVFFLVLPHNFYFPAYYIVGSMAYLYLLQHITTRGAVWQKSLFLALFMSVVTLLIFALDLTLARDNMLRALVFAFSGAIFSGVLIMALLPFFEKIFGYTTDLTFLEYSTLNHPLLKRMAVHANGTYQHSLNVGAIVEAAATEIGINPVACKVMAYFHDIGKLERPEYFAENQTGTNKHDELTPSMSAMIITSHVKYGRELAQQYHLGEKIEAAAYQHHGTSLVRYFLQQAKQSDKAASEETFRYKAEKPQSREVGLIMIADACEASVKSIREDKTYDRIGDKVKLIVSSIMEDGQLSDCNMTFSDIAKIQESVIKTLSGVYHVRPDYEELQKKGMNETRKSKQHA
ncbi:HDIG domain-containing protein [bacterium]|nr:HDIG domain-containing protein [bacterium]